MMMTEERRRKNKEEETLKKGEWKYNGGGTLYKCTKLSQRNPLVLLI